MIDENITVEVDETEYEVDFQFEASYTPAKLSGHPDNWEPSDGDSDYNIFSIWQGDNDVTSSLSDELKARVEEKVVEWVQNKGVERMEEYNEECKAEAMIDDFDDFDDPRADYAWNGPY